MWMLGFALYAELSAVELSLSRVHFPAAAVLIAALLILFTWFFVGHKLFSPQKKDKITFAVWLAGFPLVTTTARLIALAMEAPVENSHDGLSAIIFLVVWLVIGYKLYPREER